jgi:hypothetical protein
MCMTCPCLEYQKESDNQYFEVSRGYCTVVEQFVQPMRADICNDRYDLNHESHCEIYREYTQNSDHPEDGEGAQNGAHVESDDR